jgi:hypothetical protein
LWGGDIWTVSRFAAGSPQGEVDAALHQPEMKWTLRAKQSSFPVMRVAGEPQRLRKLRAVVALPLSTGLSDELPVATVQGMLDSLALASSPSPERSTGVVSA